MAVSDLVHIGICVSDLQTALRFWRDGLGLDEVQSGPSSADLTDGHHNFRIFSYAGDGRPPHVGGLASYLHIGVLVPDLHKAVRRCEDLGFSVIWDGVDGGHEPVPGELPSGSFKIADPDGIVVDVTASDDQWPGVNARR